MSAEWVVVTPHVVGDERGLEIIYTTDFQRHATRALAISHGFDKHGHDDFQIVGLNGDKVTWVGWMDLEHPAEDRQSVAAALGWTA